MTELLSAISAGAAAAGHTTELVFDEFPTSRDGWVYVVIPHEFDAWGNPRGFPDARQRAQTIALCTENPGTVWFEQTYELVSQFAAAVSINRSSAAELRRRGIRCEHLQLGYSPQWDSWLGDETVERHIDALYLAAADPRRDPILAGLGSELWAHRCEFLIPPLEPRTSRRPDFLKGAQKYQRLRSARILINLHRTSSSALEWMRFLEAICNGCVVVSEPCLDGDPLVPGEHFLASAVEDIAPTVEGLLDDSDRLRCTRERAYDFVRQEMPMEPAVKRLAELAAELPRQLPVVRDLSSPTYEQTVTSSPSPSRAETPPAGAPASNEAQPAPQAPALSGSESAPSVKTRARRHLLRSISNRMPRRQRGLQILSRTPAYAQAKPRVTVVLVAPQDTEGEAMEALASVAGSLDVELEVLLLNDPSSDLSVSALKGFFDAHPWLPAALLHESVDGGIGHSRNILAEHARGEYVFVLDATGGIYPSTLQRLVAALDRDPHAIFSYSMVAVFDRRQPVELLSSLPWEPARLKRCNWIDGMVLIRRKRLRELGCYTTDPRLAGWEDFDLWCKCAEAGGHGVHVAQVLAWHRLRANSAAGHTQETAPAQWALLRERFPRLLAPSGVDNAPSPPS